MGKDILVLRGSPRKHGNTARLAEEFERGALERGNTVTDVFLRERTINDCLGCWTCHRNGGTCVQDDDMTEINVKMAVCDVIVFAAPVYFYTWNSIMLRALDRTFAIEGTLRERAYTYYLLSAGSTEDVPDMDIMIDSFESYVHAAGNEVGGCLFAYGVVMPGEIEGRPILQEAYELGLNV